MLVNAGYITRNLTMATDSSGCRCPIIECTIYGTKFGIRTDTLKNLIDNNNAAPVEVIRHRYAPCLETTVGYAVLSKTGRAVNFFIEEWGCFTVSLASLRSVLSKRKAFARIAKISDMPVIPSYTQHLHAQNNIMTRA